LKINSCTLQIRMGLIHAMFQVEIRNYEWSE